MPNIPGIEHAITSNEALDLPELPARMAIVGGGYIAVEFCGISAPPASRVTEIIRAAEVLRGFDEEVRAFLSAQMEKRGVRILRETVVRAIEKNNAGLVLSLADGGALETDAVIYATGRAPNTRGLGLEEAGVSSATTARSPWMPGIAARSQHLRGGRLYRSGQPDAGRHRRGRAFAETHFNDNPICLDYDNIPPACSASRRWRRRPYRNAGAAARPTDVYASRFRPLKHTLSGRDESTMMKTVVDAETGSGPRLSHGRGRRAGDRSGPGDRAEVRGNEGAVRPNHRHPSDRGRGVRYHARETPDLSNGARPNVAHCVESSQPLPNRKSVAHVPAPPVHL